MLTLTSTKSMIHGDLNIKPWWWIIDSAFVISSLGWKKHKLESRLLGEISIPTQTRLRTIF